MTTTIRDVAERAGVSVKTVSRVINSEPAVREETRSHVMAVVQELGYTPNVFAQRLARGRSMVITLLFNDSTWDYLGNVLRGSLEVARQAGYSIVTHLCDASQLTEQQEVLRMVAQHRVDGFIFTPPCDNAPDLVDELQQKHVPFVRLTPHDRRLPLPHVTASEYHGARDVTEHLLALGHRRIGFVVGNPDHSASHDRLAGFRDTLEMHRVPFDLRLVCQGDWSFQSGMSCARALLDLHPCPTAILASNDDMAAGVLSIAHRLGIPVPAALSVAGFDDVLIAQQVWPPLTTVRQPIFQIAQLASRLLVDLMKGKELPVLHHEIPTELIVRESTGPAPEVP